LKKLKKMKLFLIIVFAAQAQGNSKRFQKKKYWNLRESPRSSRQIPFEASTCSLFSAGCSKVQSFHSTHENAEKTTTTIYKQQRLVRLLRMVLNCEMKFLNKTLLENFVFNNHKQDYSSVFSQCSWHSTDKHVGWRKSKTNPYFCFFVTRQLLSKSTLLEVSAIEIFQNWKIQKSEATQFLVELNSFGVRRNAVNGIIHVCASRVFKCIRIRRLTKSKLDTADFSKFEQNFQKQRSRSLNFRV